MAFTVACGGIQAVEVDNAIDNAAVTVSEAPAVENTSDTRSRKPASPAPM